jgi:biopolymer transport protein ExbD
MSFIPEVNFKSKESVNLAPIIDFLFLMLMFFATLAISRVTTKDTDIELVEVASQTSAVMGMIESDHKIISININDKGEYKWVTEIRDYQMANSDDIVKELLLQHQKGLLPEEKSKTKVMLKIDKQATWDPILKAIIGIREAGFEARPVYLPIVG